MCGGGQASCFHKCSCSVLDFKALFEYVMNRFTKEQLALMAVICRCIWLRRNSLIFEGIFLHPNTLMMEAINAQDEYRRCLSPEARIEEGQTSCCDRRSRWTYPSEGIYKCNWDASVNVTKGWVDLGIVVRDYYGLILGAKCITMEMVKDSSLAEVMGALYAVQFCKEVGFFDVLFEGDVNTVVKEINSAPPFFYLKSAISLKLSMMRCKASDWRNSLLHLENVIWRRTL